MHKVRILQINKLYYPVTGGIERVVQQVAEGLKNQTDMKVLVCREKGKKTVEIINGIKVYRAGSFGILFSMPLSPSFIIQLRRLSKDRDVLHFHMPFPLGDIAYILSGYKGKVVVWWHSDIVRQKKLMKIYAPIMKKFLDRVDVIVVATQGHIEGSDYLSAYRDKCVVIPYGVEKSIEKEAYRYLSTKTSNDKDNKAVNMLFVGRLVYYKGCEILIKAFSKINNAKLTIIGSGELENKLKLEVIKLDIQDKVQFIGNVSEYELQKAYEKCDVFILPSIVKSEAFGLVQLEAMVYGKPVINTNLPSGVPYVSLDKITGITVPPNDVQALTEAMNWMVEHEEERLEMGRKARERVENNFTMEEMLRRMLLVYTT